MWFTCKTTYNRKPPVSLDYTVILEEIEEIGRSQKQEQKALEKNEQLIKNPIEQDALTRKKENTQVELLVDNLKDDQGAYFGQTLKEKGRVSKIIRL